VGVTDGMPIGGYGMTIGIGAFDSCYELTIYAGIGSINNSKWRNSGDKLLVIFGCVLSDDSDFVISVNMNSATIYNNRIFTGGEVNSPFRDGHTFAGWYDNEAFTGDAISANDIESVPYGVTLYARWLPV